MLDREFSYLELLERLEVEQIQFVIRLKLGDKRRQTHFVDADGQPIKLYVQPGQKVIYRNVFYLGVVKVNLIGYWRKGLSSPLWVMTSLEPEQGLLIYQARMKIEIVCTQITKTRGFTIGAGWDDVADFNFFIVNDHSINQQFYQFPALFKIQIIQGWLNTLAKLLDVVCQCKGLNLFLGLVFQLSQLLPEPVLSLVSS